MALLKIKDFDPRYKETLGGDGLQGFDVYTDVGNDKVGTVQDILVSESGQLRYLIVEVGFWIFGKSVLVPVGRCRVNNDHKRIFLSGFSKRQAEQLPEFNEKLRVDKDYERRVRGVYRHQQTPATAATVPLTDLYGPSATAVPSDSAAHRPSQPPVDYRHEPQIQQPLAGHHSIADRHQTSHPVKPEGLGVEHPVQPPVMQSHPASATGWPGNVGQPPVMTEPASPVAPDPVDATVNDPDEQDPFFYDLDEKDRLIMKLYQERLMARQRLHQPGSTTQPQ